MMPEAFLPNMKKPCANCPFRKDTIAGWLGTERMTEILNSGSFVCHKTIRNKAADRKQCAGHMLMRGSANAFVREAEGRGILLVLEGQELVFETEKECIEHHG